MKIHIASAKVIRQEEMILFDKTSAVRQKRYSEYFTEVSVRLELLIRIMGCHAGTLEGHAKKPLVLLMTMKVVVVSVVI